MSDRETEIVRLNELIDASALRLIGGYGDDEAMASWRQNIKVWSEKRDRLIKERDGEVGTPRA